MSKTNRTSVDRVAVGVTGKSPYIRNYIGNSKFPYRDDYEDFSYSKEEDELQTAIARKYRIDGDGVDPFNTRDRRSSVNIPKVTEIAQGLSPFPDMYKARDGYIGKSAENIENVHAHGFYVGSKVSGHTYDSDIYDSDDESNEPVYSLEDLAKKQLKEYIRKVLAEVL